MMFMTDEQIKEFTKAVDATLKREGIDCFFDGYHCHTIEFSKSPCESCGSTLAGKRYETIGLRSDNNYRTKGKGGNHCNHPTKYDVCETCYGYFNLPCPEFYMSIGREDLI